MYSSKRSLNQDPKWYRDPFGLILNALVFAFLSFIGLLPTMLCYTGLDPANFVFPETLPVSRGLIRFIICTLIITEIVSNLCLSHVTLLMLTLHCNANLRLLKFYRRPEQEQEQVNRKWRKVSNTAKFQTLSDLQLYQVLETTYRVLRQYTDTAALFIMGPGFFIDVLANYVVIMMYGKIPLLLYALISLIAVVVPMIVMGELPIAGKSNELSGELIRDWRLRSGSKRRSDRVKTLASLHPVGFWIGRYFLIRRQTLGTYVDGILNYTVTTILS